MTLYRQTKQERRGFINKATSSLPKLIKPKQISQSETFHVMQPVELAQPSLPYERDSGSLCSDFFFLFLLQTSFSSPFLPCTFLFLQTGPLHLVHWLSSRTGYTKLINFQRTTPPPNGAAALCGPVHNAVMTPRSKVTWPVPQLRGKIALARCVV